MCSDRDVKETDIDIDKLYPLLNYWQSVPYQTRTRAGWRCKVHSALRLVLWV